MKLFSFHDKKKKGEGENWIWFSCR